MSQTETKQEFFNIENNQYKITTLEKKKYKRMPTGYGIIQTEIMKLKDLSIQAKAIYCLLASYTGSKDYCFPSIKTISFDLNISEKLVYKYMKELKEKGLIIVSKLYTDSRNNHKYEICYIDNVENDNIQHVDNVNVGGVENEQFINNNSFNNNNIINSVNFSNEKYDVPIKKSKTKKEKKTYYFEYDIDYKSIQNYYNSEFEKTTQNNFIWTTKDAVNFSKFIDILQINYREYNIQSIFEHCFYALKDKFGIFDKIKNIWLITPSPSLFLKYSNDIILYLNHIIRGKK